MARYNQKTSHTPDHFRDMAVRIAKIAERYDTLAVAMEQAGIETLDVPAFKSFEGGIVEVVTHCNRAHAIFDKESISRGSWQPSVSPERKKKPKA